MTDNIQAITPADEAEIKNVIRRYSENLDGRNFPKLAEAYTETGSMVNSFEEYIPGGEAFTGTLASGAGAVATAVGNLMGPLDATQHLLGAILIDATEGGCSHADAGSRAAPPRRWLLRCRRHVHRLVRPHRQGMAHRSPRAPHAVGQGRAECGHRQLVPTGRAGAHDAHRSHTKAHRRDKGRWAFFAPKLVPSPRRRRRG